MMARMYSLFLYYFLAMVLGETEGHAQILVKKETGLNKTDTLEQLFTDYFEWKLRTYPEWATKEGFKGYSHLVEDYSLEAVRAKEAKCKEFVARSSKLVAENKEEEIYQNIFQVKINNFLLSYFMSKVSIGINYCHCFLWYFSRISTPKKEWL